MSEEDKTEEDSFSPGFLSEEGFLFEQIADQTYVTNLKNPNESSKPDMRITVEIEGKTYHPLNKCPWFLAEEPIIYGNEEELWNETRQFIKEHLYLEDEKLYDVLTAWVHASWIPEVWTVVPYPFFYGPVASGKTRALEVLHRICYRGILSANITTAALFRACNQWHPTIILDEAEIYNKVEKGEIISLLNSGYRRGQFAIRVKTNDKGEFLQTFDVFGFKALAGTQGLAKALESRCILIKMMKNRRKVRFLIDEEAANKIRGKLLMMRFNTLGSCAVSAVSAVFLERVGDLKLENGRLQELFQSLVAVSNHGRENILEYAREMLKDRQFEELTSVEADIVKIMSDSTISKTNNIILTKDITDKLNIDRSDKDKYKTRSVGWIIRRLGFKPRRSGTNKGWLFDQDRLKKLAEIYLIEPEELTPFQKNGTNGKNGTALEDLKSVGWSNDFYGKHTCAVCGYEKMTSRQAETFKGEKVWICEDCKNIFEKRQEVSE